MTETQTSAWSSPCSGWHAESKPFTESFTPTRDSLVFVQLLNSSVEHDGFNVAFFNPDIAIDCLGRVLRVPHERFEAITLLARETQTLPNTGSFRNTWRLKHARTDRDILRLLIKIDGEEMLKETSIYGYEKGREELQKEVQGMTTLPGILQELFGLLEEAKEGYRRGDVDTALIESIEALL